MLAILIQEFVAGRLALLAGLVAELIGQAVSCHPGSQLVVAVGIPRAAGEQVPKCKTVFKSHALGHMYEASTGQCRAQGQSRAHIWFLDERVWETAMRCGRRTERT